MAGNFNLSTVGQLTNVASGALDNVNGRVNKNRKSNINGGFADDFVYGDGTGNIIPNYNRGVLDYIRNEANYISPLYSDTQSLTQQWENLDFGRTYDTNIGPEKRLAEFASAGFARYDPNRGGWRFDTSNASAALKGFGLGAQTGNIYAAIAGAVLGGGSNIIQALTEPLRMKNVNSQINYKKDMGISAFNRSALNSGLYRNLMNDVHSSALGGPLNTNGGDFTTGLKDIAAGSTHELNPYGGVLMGMDREGNPNFVEEGEQIYNDYVYSARMEMPDELADKYHLQKKTTFADGIKKLHKEYEERPNDVISRNGFNAIASELAQTQEILRQMQQVQEMENQYKCGGRMKKFAGGGPFTEKPPQDLKLGYFDFTPEYDYRDFNYPTYFNQPYEPYELKVKETPINSEHRKSIFEGPQYVLSDSDILANVANEVDAQLSRKDLRSDLISSLPGRKGNMDMSEDFQDYPEIDIPEIQTGSENPEIESVLAKEEGTQGNFAQRAALAGNLISLLNNLRPVDYHNANRIGRAYRSINSNVGFTPISRTMNYEALNPETYISPLRSSMAATRNAITDLAGGNRAARAAMLLGAERNYADNLGKTLEAIEKSNLEQRKAVNDFNRATESANASMGMQAQAERLKAQEIIAQGLAQEAAFRDTLEARRSQAIGNAFNTLTQTLQGIGKENFIYNQLKSAGYSYAYKDRNGNIIYRSPEGKLVSEKDLIAALNSVKNNEKEKDND